VAAKPECWVAIGDFTYSTGTGGHIRFIVERNTENPALHGISSDEDKGAPARRRLHAARQRTDRVAADLEGRSDVRRDRARRPRHRSALTRCASVGLGDAELVAVGVLEDRP
jgi:16S rRNA C1402 N4-methylase RsmH